MKFCMVTTFFGAQSFGGDAAYVDRLSRALARRGHEVHVFHCADSFEAVRGKHPLRPFEPAPGVQVHLLKSRAGVLSPLATHLTGKPFFKGRKLREAFEKIEPDVVHFHNISLVGGPGVLDLAPTCTRIMTAHEHWLICQMHLLWKYDQKICERPSCATCALAGKRPPQFWRRFGGIERGLQNLDALIFPSLHALNEHRKRGVGAPMVHLPYFLPDDWSGGIEDEEPERSARPYLAAAGRLVKMKGFQRIIPLMRQIPEIDLRIAGTGPYEPTLRALARDVPNVRFEGLLDGKGLARLFHGARAVAVPSLFPETFGYVVLEAFAVRTPVIVNLNGGALAETGVASGGGLGYRTDSEWIEAARRLVRNRDLRDELADGGFANRTGEWSEAAHLDRYFELIKSLRALRAVTPHSRKGNPSKTSVGLHDAQG